MIEYGIFGISNGQLVRVGQCPEQDYELQASPGQYISQGIFSRNTHYYANGIVQEYTLEQAAAFAAKPAYPCTWDLATFSWVDLRVLEDVKAYKRLEINAARLKANTSSFVFLGKEIAYDEISRIDINGVNGYVSIFGQLPPDFPGGWKAMDNTYVAIPDVDTWKTFIASMVGRGTASFAKAQLLKAQIDVPGKTIAEIEAISWNSI